ncbi:MAG TPA: hypothetical protein VM889_12615 [Candidatus Thermoplasmatota archaeon]|nr:hypothetical protein [Candidatus Thermoplasmatota archaeon]
MKRSKVDLPLAERTGYRTPYVAGGSGGTLPPEAMREREGDPIHFAGFGAAALASALPVEAFPLTTGEILARWGVARLASPGDTFLAFAWFLMRMPDERWPTKRAFLDAFLLAFPAMAPRVPTEGGPA